ncbi:MAG: BrnA antitoxin family protein [Pseudoxanthomonas sp.]
MSTKQKHSAWVDPDDAPVWTEADFAAAEYRIGDKVVSRDEAKAAIAKSRGGRPPIANPKQAVKLRLDPDILAALRATGDGWQTRVNDTLRANLQLAGKL